MCDSLSTFRVDEVHHGKHDLAYITSAGFTDIMLELIFELEGRCRVFDNRTLVNLL